MYITYSEWSLGLGLTLDGHEVFSKPMALLCWKWRKKLIQNEICSISEMVRVGKEEMEQNPCASWGASPYLHFLLDLFFLVSLFHSLCICSIRSTVFCFLSLHFHRQMKWLWICTHSIPQEAVSLLKFRSLSSLSHRR